MLNRFSTSAKLYMLIFITAVSLIGLGIYAVGDLKKMDDNTKTIYSDRIVCIQQLSIVRFEYDSEILPVAQSVKNRKLTFAQAKERVLKAKGIIDTNWANYKRTYLTPEEKALVKQTEAVKNQAHKVIENLLSILTRGDAKSLNILIQQGAFDEPAPLALKVNQLLSLQVNVAKEVLNDNKLLYRRTAINFVSFILLSLVIAISLSFYIIKNIKGLIKDILSSNDIIKESEEKYRSLLEQASDAIYLSDINGNFTEVNESLCKITGYSKDELLQLNIKDIIDPEQLKADPIIQWQNLQERSVIRERRLIRKDGKIFEVESNVKRIADNQVLVIARDITERKLMEAGLREAEAKFRTAFEYSAIGIAMVSLKGNWLKVNISLCEMLGYSEQEFLAMSIFDITHPDDDSLNFDVINSVLTSENGVKHIEKRYIRKNGSEVWASVNTALIRDAEGAPLYFVTQILDISAHKKAEYARKLIIENEERIRVLFDNVEGATCLLDTNFRLIIFNNVFIKTSVLLSGEKPQIGDEVYGFLPSDEKKRRYEILNRVLAGNKEIFEVEYEKNGETLYFRTTLIPIIIDGKVTAISAYSIDFTERKRAELLILKGKELSETIINSLPGVFYLQSASGQYLLWNKNFETMTGYTREEIAKLRTEDLVVKEDLEKVTDAIKKLFIEGYVTVEANAKMKDGTRIPFLLTGSPIMYENQLCLLGTGIDISLRIKTEEELRSSEQKYKLLFESNPVPLTMIAKDDLSIIAVNEAAAHLYGYRRDEFLHSSVSIVRLKEDLEAQRRLFRTAVTSPTEREVTRHVKKDGTIFFVQTNVNDIIYNGRPVRLVMSNDVTEKLKAEELLKKSEANLKAIMDTTDTAYALLDKELNVVAFNQMAVKFVNSQFQHNPVQGDKFADYFPKERFSQFLSYSNQVLMGANINYEANYPQNDGSVLWYDVRLFPITNKQNEIFGLMISLSDVTERKKSEIQLAELNEDLQKHIKELAISNAELEQFAYVASHDLQEPLRMVTSFMTQLEKKYGDVVDDKGRQYIHFAVDGAKRMRQIILDLLDFSRVGRTEDDQEKIDFNKVVNEVLALYRRQIEEIRAEVAFDNLPVIYTYKTPFRQVFQNLIGNSLKYHTTDKVPVIKISCKETRTHFQFSIKDNGIGISPEYFDKIFIIFQRLHNKDEYSGTGMGLAITKKIIEGLGGKIWVESSAGKGSTFYFTILKKDKS